MQRPQIPEVLKGLENHLKLSRVRLKEHAKRLNDFERFIEFVEARQYALGYLKDIIDRYGGLPQPPKTVGECALLAKLQNVLDNSGIPVYARDRKELERTFNTLVGKVKPTNSKDGKEKLDADEQKVKKLTENCSTLKNYLNKIQYELALRQHELDRIWTATALEIYFPINKLRYHKNQKVLIFLYYKDGRIRCRRKVKILHLLKGVVMSPENPIYQVEDLKTGEVLTLKQSAINPSGTELTVKGVIAYKAKYNSWITRFGSKSIPDGSVVASFPKKKLVSIKNKKRR